MLHVSMRATTNVLRHGARSAARRLLGAVVSRTYAVGIYAGPHPLALAPLSGAENPVLTGASVTDVLATDVADPFMIAVDGGWHMFFEVVSWTGAARKGVIGWATSRDGLRWRYERIVLAEPFHLSYPQVFRSGSDIYMVPESRQAGAVRLYRADPFPLRWTLVGELVSGALADASLFEHEGRWWMLASPQRDTLRLLHATVLTGPWREHPASPVVRGDPRTARPGGRVVATRDGLIRFAQDSLPAYGARVRAIAITQLDEREYEERELGTEAVLAGSGAGWNRSGMHHVDAHPRPDGTWLACVDGWAGVRGPGRLVRAALGRPSAPRG